MPDPSKISGEIQEQVDSLLGRDSKLKSWDNTIKGKYESFWLYRESHPWRLGQHITSRGVYAGSTLGLLLGVPYVMLRKRGSVYSVMSSLGKIVARGAIGGGILLGLVAVERLYHLDKTGIEDRAYRISYNWAQTKWDIFCIEGALLGGALLRRPFYGTIPAIAVGTALGTFAYIGHSAWLHFA